MTEATNLGKRIDAAIRERAELESRLQNEKGELAEAALSRYDEAYARLQRQVARLFQEADDEEGRIRLMLELMRILENRLVYLQNFTIDPAPDNQLLAQLAVQFIDELQQQHRSALTPLEATYFRAVAALYSGDAGKAREGFAAACASEESDEANDIKYKSYVILGHLSHEERDYAKAKELHEHSLRYSANCNVTAQALALKALNSYALHEYDEALHLFEEALSLFDENQPFFNSYFHRNALLFCGAIYFDRRDFAKAAERYRAVLQRAEPNSYDHFDALSQLGRIDYLSGRYDEAVRALEEAIAAHDVAENEYLIDTWFWLARCHLERNEPEKARTYLEKIASSDVQYEKKPQAVELLQKVS